MSGLELSELPDSAEELAPYVRALRRAALQELPGDQALSHRFLLKFLRARDFDVDSSLKLLLNYQTWRRSSPELSSCLSPLSVLGLLRASYHAVLPLRDHRGSRVLLYRIGQWNPKDWSALQVFRLSLMTSEVIAMETQTQRRGIKVIYDLQGWCLGHALQVTPSLARKISSVLSASFPLKVRGVHLLSMPLLFRPILDFLRPFLPEKIRQRIHVHGSDFCHSLRDFFSAPVLPPEYGGEGLSVEEACQAWTNQLLRSPYITVCVKTEDQSFEPKEEEEERGEEEEEEEEERGEEEEEEEERGEEEEEEEEERGEEERGEEEEEEERGEEEEEEERGEEEEEEERGEEEEERGEEEEEEKEERGEEEEEEEEEERGEEEEEEERGEEEEEEEERGENLSSEAEGGHSSGPDSDEDYKAPHRSDEDQNLQLQTSAPGVSSTSASETRAAVDLKDGSGTAEGSEGKTSRVHGLRLETSPQVQGLRLETSPQVQGLRLETSPQVQGLRLETSPQVQSPGSEAGD
uniref:CRAL-TRIO domain-containing protein n=1 Tax=Knipowitschia caucasica TaxID=637954 RepID=A0AAV2JU60_KNICA